MVLLRTKAYVYTNGVYSKYLQFYVHNFCLSNHLKSICEPNTFVWFLTKIVNGAKQNLATLICILATLSPVA